MYHIIINPASRSGRGLKLWKEIVEPALHKEGTAFRCYFSKGAGDVAHLAAEITSSMLTGHARPEAGAGSKDGTKPEGCIESENPSDPRQVLVILGGDGTMNEALQGICEPSKIVLGYIPTGSSNDLARDLPVPTDPAAALDRILHSGAVHSMDMGVLHYPDGEIRRFAVSCGIGFDAAVCEEALHSRMKTAFNKIGLGKLTYLGIALKQLLTARLASCEISLDDKPPIRIRRLLFVACMNHRYEGGGFQFCPDADDHDGILNLCAVGDLPRLLILLALPTAFWGKHFLFPGVNPYRAQKVHIRVSRPLWIHTDGEVTRRSRELTAVCERNALNIIY